MNRLTILLFILAIVGIGGGVVWYLTDTRNDAFGVAPVATSTPEVHEGLAIYTNGPYGFSVFYPENAAVHYTFDTEYHLGSAWRANALPDTEGAPIVEIVPYAVSSNDSYPRYFNAMVRVGASSAPDELTRCEKAGAEQGETALPDVSIGGRAWKAFSFQDAGMMQYVRGVSYRTIYEGKCIALEKVQTGSSYRDEANTKDIADETLQTEYEALSAIVESFAFAR